MSAQSKFEAEKDKILKDLPESAKKMFGIMGFAKADVDDDSDDEDDNSNAENKPKNAAATQEDQYIPILILSPYDVPPRPFRDVYWFDMYSKFKRSKKLNNLDYIVYHYGKDLSDCYSFIAQDEFTTWEDGVAAGYDKLPADLQAKVDSGADLTEDEEERVRGIKEMLEDVPKAPEDRKRGILFVERHDEKKGPPPSKKRKTK